MKFLCTSLLALSATMVALIAACCILENVYAPCASSQASIMDKDQPNHVGKNVRHHHFDTTVVSKPDRFLQYFNATGLSSHGHWVPFGNEIKGEAGENLGYSVATSNSGNFIIIGGPLNNENGRNSGRAQVFQYKEDTQQWEQVGGDITGENAGDISGWSVDINNDGDVVVIGAINNHGSGVNSGYARVYHYIDGDWVKKGQDLDGEVRNDKFGLSVAISGDGDKVVIGGPHNDRNGMNSGHAQIYEYREDTQKWEQIGRDILGEEQYDALGWSVDINGVGNVVIIGVPYYDGNGANMNSGQARVYHFINGQWVQQGQDLDGRSKGDKFGHSVSISGNGDKVIIGNGQNSGRAQVFQYREDTQQWQQVGGDITGGNTGDVSSWSVDINNDGDVVVIGADDRSGVNSGYASVYRYIHGDWVQQVQDLDGQKKDGFGISVAISGDGDKVVIGGPYNDANGVDSGLVRAFIFEKPPTVQPSSQFPSFMPSNSPSASPSILPLPSLTPTACHEDGEAQFYHFTKANGEVFKRRCKWLQDQADDAKVARICRRTESYNSYGPANEVCRKTCGTCDKAARSEFPSITPSSSPFALPSVLPSASPSSAPSLTPTTCHEDGGAIFHHFTRTDGDVINRQCKWLQDQADDAKVARICRRTESYNNYGPANEVCRKTCGTCDKAARTEFPSITPSSSPFALPSVLPSASPSSIPTALPTAFPSSAPSLTPTTCHEDGGAIFHHFTRTDGDVINRQCKWLQDQADDAKVARICRRTESYNNYGPANEVCRKTCGTCGSH